MIYVTQGHEKGIGLEVFLKSFICLNKNQKSQFVLYCFERALNEVLKSINFNIESLDLNIKYVKEQSSSQTLSCINEAIMNISSKDILLTLPSSKDQFYHNQKNYSGHTEYFREKFNNSNLVMSFYSRNLNVVLLTDHIPLSKVSSSITIELIIEKIKSYLSHENNFLNIKRVFFSGINPHCGEDGLMGDEDQVISLAITSLKELYPSINFEGPISGDTLFFEPNSKNDLFVYSSHDQGLTVFKQYNGLLGINLTMGMPFIRISPDHGTAFNMYGKNKANYLGMNYLLNEISNWNNS